MTTSALAPTASFTEASPHLPAEVLLRGSHVLLVVLLAIVLRALSRRGIGRITRGVASGRISRGIHHVGSRTPMFVDVSPMAAERRRQRANTLGAVLGSVASAAIGTVAVVTVLGELGIDLAPIVASAGVVGVALGFGAQTLVKDVLAGFFLLLEDAYGVGDVVDLGAASGTVETVALRTTRLRDADGVIWHVRNGEIARVGNTSQGGPGDDGAVSPDG